MFEDFKNSIDFFLRKNIRFSRKNFIEKNKKIIQRNVAENQYIFDILTKYIQPINKDKARILDIGSKNWFYARAEYDFFKKNHKDFVLDGVEIDAYRLYSNFYNRFEVAKYYIKDLKNVNYIVANLLDIDKNYDYILWFLPFVLPRAHVMWGLPKKIFYPEKLLIHAFSLLNKNGKMLIVNQGEKEALKQKELLEKLCISYLNLGEVKSNYFNYQNKRFGFLIEKD